MHQLQVFRAERELGLESLIRNSASFVTSATVEPISMNDLPQVQIDKIEKQWRQVVASSNREFSADLFYLRSVLATVGWNKNDDIFASHDTWHARHTADNKMLNIGHKHNRIIGHMLESYAIDGDANLLADDTEVDALPAKFSIVNGEVIYTWLNDEELQEQVSQLVTEITAQQSGEIEPKWFVSMECLIRGFDYGLHDLDTGESLVVARNQKTAFLSQHLKACKGSGQFKNYRIGRVLRDFFFSGKGFTEDPANPESDILSDHDAFFQASANFVTDFSQERTKSVYSVSAQFGNENEFTDVPSEVTSDMTISIEDALKGEIAELKQKLEQATAQVNEASIKQYQEQINELEQAVASAKTEISDLTSAKVAATEQLSAVNAKVEELEQAKAELVEASQKLTERAEAAEGELAQIRAEAIKAERIALVAKKLELSEEAAANVVATLEGADDEKFAASLEVFASMAPKTGAPTGAKSTNLPSQPTATGLPAPMRAAASTEAPAADDDDILEELEPVAAATLNGDDEGLASVVASVHSYFGCKKEG